MEFKSIDELVEALIEKYDPDNYYINIIMQSDRLANVMIFQGASDEDELEDAFVVFHEEDEENWRVVKNEKSFEACVNYMDFLISLSEALDLDDQERDGF